MGQRLATALLLTGIFMAGPAPAAQLRITGTVHTKDAGTAVNVRAWALGPWAVHHPEAMTHAIAETRVSGGSFSLAIPEEALPVRVEASAKGHVARAFTVALPEQAALPPVLLPAGRSLTVRVQEGRRPVEGAAVWGDALLQPWGGLPGRWHPALARELTDASGLAHCTVPGDPFFLELFAVGQHGRWGTLTRRGAAGGSLRLILGASELPIRVTRRDGEPAGGVLLTCPGAPAGTGTLTAKDGTAILWVDTARGWSVTAEAGGRMATAGGTALPPDGKSVRLVLDTPPTVALHVEGAPGHFVVQPDFFGGASPSRFLAAGNGTLDLPVPHRGRCLLWGPGLTPAQLTVEPGAPPLAVTLRRAATVSGRVVDPAGNPVAGAAIVPRVTAWWRILNAGDLSDEILVPLPAPLAITGPDGRFNLGELPAAPMLLQAQAAGYPPVRSERLPLPPGAHPEVLLQLEAGATLSLRVTDPQGAPLQGVQVGAHLPGTGGPNRGAVLLGGGLEGTALGEAVASAKTGPEGRATLRAVPTGSVRVQLRKSGFVTRTVEDVEIPAGGADLGDVEMEPGVTVAGTVVDPGGKPVAGAQVMASRTAEAPVFSPTVSADDAGRFEVPDLEPSGELYLKARAEHWVPAPPLKVVLPPEGEVRVKVLPERSLAGHVVEKGSGAPIAGAAVHVTVARTVTIPGMGTMKTYVSAAALNTGGDGSFKAGGLAPGPIQLRVTAHGHQDATRDLEIPDNADPQPVLIELEKGLDLRGRVVDPEGGPVAGAHVRTMARPYRETQSGPDGSFVLDGLSAGSYEVEASSADGLHGTASGVAGATDELVVRLQRARRILGRVLGPQGEPLAGVRIQVWGPTRIAPVTTGAAGSFTVEQVFPGDVRLRASKEGYAVATRDITVPDDRDPTVEITLKRGGVVEGEIRGLTSSELERCTVTARSAGTQPGPDGRFQLRGVPTGTVTVTAVVLPGNRSRSAVATVQDTETPAHVTIDFTSGLQLSGTVTRAGLPVEGLLVQVHGIGLPGGGSTATDSDGAFELTGLEAGEYQLSVLSGAGEPLTGRHILLSTDTSLELQVPAGGIEGSVSASDTGTPLSGATLVARRNGLPQIEKRTSSDSGGNFHFDEMADGSYLLHVSAEGYQSASKSVTVADGLLTHAGVSLDRGEGLVLVVHGAGGTPAANVSVAAMAGGIVGADFWTGCDAGGRCRLEELPKGDWTLFVAGDGTAIVHVKNPGPEVPVQLRPTGTLGIQAHPGGDGTLWRTRIVDGASGLAVPVQRRQNPGGTEWIPVPAGGLFLRLPAGSYTVEGAGPGGVSASRTVTVEAQRQSAVDLDAASTE